MTRTSLSDERSVERFLKTQRLRYRETRRIYGHLLRAFQRSVSKHSPSTQLSVADLQQWLRERRKEWPLHMVCHRARLVERFLEWLHARGVISKNPFEQLHRDYGSRTTPIVRALACDDVEKELQRLRPLPRFGSFLGSVMEKHVTLMRSLGYRYDVNEGMLLRFDRFLQSHADWNGKPLVELINAWGKFRTSPNQLREVCKVGRLLSKAMHRLDPKVAIIPTETDLERRVCQQERRPYVYSDEEIKRLLQAALSFPSPKAPLRPVSLYTMLVLAYCVGLRRGEIVKLTLKDLNLQDDTIEIRQTKFFKHRRLPVAPTVMAALKYYLAARQESGAPMSPDSDVFWSERLGKRYSYGTVGILLVRVLRRAGLKPIRGRIGPRVHDLRHAMVGHRMRDWYREGINPESKLPHVATYLGHKDITSTLVYLNSTPELLHEASERFRKNGGAIVRVKEGTV